MRAARSDLSQPRPVLGARADTAAAVAIAVAVAAMVVGTEPELPVAARALVDAVAIGAWLAFVVEWLARVTTARGGRVRSLVGPAALCDLAALALGACALAGMTTVAWWPLLRLPRLLLVLRLPGYQPALATLHRVVWSRRGELAVMTAVVAALLVVFGVLIHAVEHEAQPRAFASALDGLWWAVTTMATIGYGDLVPVTPLGRVIGGAAALIGVGIITLPAGIIASGFLAELRHPPPRPSQRRRRERLSRRRAG